MSEIKPCPELVEAKAEIVYQAKLLIKLRRKIAMFVHDIEDEGDRVYFGSTNDADDLRALYAELDEFEWSRMEKNAKGRDLYAELRTARQKARDLAADRDRASDACASVQRERDELREMLGEVLAEYGYHQDACSAHDAGHCHCGFDAFDAKARAFLARYEGGR